MVEIIMYLTERINLYMYCSTLTSVLPVTCFAAMLWPELWLQWRSDYCGLGCSGVTYLS